MAASFHPLYRREATQRVHVFDATAMPWHETANPGLKLKSIINDDERGEFLGLIAFDALTKSGLHQHQGVATSFVVCGGLTDYHGAVGLHEVGINLRGSTHDAMAYTPTMLISRLEGPVTYPPEAGPLTGLHAGSRHANFSNPDPDVPPEINVPIDQMPMVPTGIDGLVRQTAFDYAGTGSDRRMVQWRVRPETVVPTWRASHGVECWVRGGTLIVNGQQAHANAFVVIEPGAEVTVESPFGAIVMVWADGAERWPAGVVAGNLFGF